MTRDANRSEKNHQTHGLLKKTHTQYLPKKTVCVIHPLVYELCSDGLRIVWKSDVLQGVQK